jgi:carbon-monoxide dehydrogenase medium subunit
MIHTETGKKKLPLKEFFQGPGKTRLLPGEIVKSIFLPCPPSGAKGTYLSIGRNAMGDLAAVAVTVLGWSAKSSTSGYQFRIYLSAVAPTVIPALEAEEYLASHKVSDEVIDKTAALAMDASSPIDDIRSGKEYRKAMVKELTKKALLQVIGQLKGKDKEAG